jgi:AraC-like DNA-binding protein
MIGSHFIRSATLSGYVKAASEVGLDPYPMLKKVGIKDECLEDPDLLISQDSVVGLLAISAEQSGHSDFGARAAIARGVPDLGAVSLLLREAETVESALQTMLTQLHLHGDGASISIDSGSAEAFIGLRVSAGRGINTLQGTEFGACGLVQVIRWLIGANWKPQRVCFAHPGVGQARVQRAFFQSPVCYEQSSSGVLIDRQTLQKPVETSSPFLRRQAKRYLESAFAIKQMDFSARVLEVIAQMLPRDTCSADNVALALGIDRRTLARRLERNGESYASLLQRARCEIAQQIAADSRLSLTDAAEVTGFQNLSSFSRWFRTTFGYSPTEWRQVSSPPALPVASGLRQGLRARAR